MSYYRNQLEEYLKSMNVTAETVIDLGGKQNPVENRTKSWNVKNYFILDLPEYDVEKPIAFLEKADILFCLEVFEYLINPIIAMENIKNLLNLNGTAIISVPLIYPLHNEIDKDSLRYTNTGIKRIVEIVGLKIKKIIERKAKTDTLERYYAEDGMKAAKGYNHKITGYIFEINK